MGKWDRFKEAFGIPNEEEDILENVEEMSESAPRERGSSLKKEQAPIKSGGASMPSKGQVNMVIIRSVDYSDARTVADHILGNRAVLLNLENCNKEMAQRILDFLSGVVYAQGGDLQRVAHSTYAVTPRNVGLQGELAEESHDEEF